MNQAQTYISDNEFLVQFANQTLDPVYFDHKGHIRLAYLYLQRYDLESAISEISHGIQAYASSLGATDKFHITITDAITRIISSRLRTSNEQGFQFFIDANSDLLNDAIAVLCQYYSYDLLMSDDAKMRLVAPDLKSI